MLKKVLREMGEPLCTYKLYIEFRDVNMLEQEMRLQRVVDIFSKMHYLFRASFFFLLDFLMLVIAYEKYNKMNAYNLATVFTPNLFRPFEVTQNDLIYSSHLSDTLKMILVNYFTFNKDVPSSD